MKNITLNTLNSVIGGLSSKSVKIELAYDEVIDYGSGLIFFGAGDDGEYIASYDVSEGIKVNSNLFSQQYLHNVATASVYGDQTCTSRQVRLDTLPGNKLLLETTFFFD